jgi:hypothetical protein
MKPLNWRELRVTANRRLTCAPQDCRCEADCFKLAQALLQMMPDPLPDEPDEPEAFQFEKIDDIRKKSANEFNKLIEILGEDIPEPVLYSWMAIFALCRLENYRIKIEGKINDVETLKMAMTEVAFSLEKREWIKRKKSS